jgi:hypothetical protein
MSWRPTKWGSKRYCGFLGPSDQPAINEKEPGRAPLTRFCGNVLYLSHRAARIPSTASPHLRSRFPILLRLGRDDLPAHLLCALSAARSSARFAEVWHSMALHVPPEGNGLLRSVFMHWPRASAVADLAKRLGSDERSLRRSMRRNGLPPPSEILRAVHLLKWLRFPSISAQVIVSKL